MSILRCAIGLIALGFAVEAPVAAAPDAAANVVSVQGDGEYREGERRPWRPARIEQALFAGNFVRTAEYSRMALLFRDRTQVRLAEKTLLRIKDTTGETRLRIDVGRAWSQSKTLPHRLYMETPSATAAVRGTDWELEVAPDGRSVITVLSGEVEFYNQYGRVRVGRNESAQAEVGKPPVKLVLVRPRDRVQWVSAFAIQPLRHITLAADRAALRTPERIASPVARGRALADLGRWQEAGRAFAQALAARPDDAAAQLGMGFVDLQQGRLGEARAHFDQATRVSGADAERLALGRIALSILKGDLAAAHAGLAELLRRGRPTQPAPYLLLADLALYEGDSARAVERLREGIARFPDDARLHVALARAYLFADARARSREALAQALERDPDSHEARLAAGDLARIEGDASGARRDYAAAIALRPGDDRGWFGLGRVETETENVRAARLLLDRALALDPLGPGYRGERGTLETFANEFEAARADYDAALSHKPNDYVALTGLGLLELKRGRTQAALDAFLRAGVIEPRFARVHVYTAVAYYQLGRSSQALGELARAAELDDKDPLPHFMASIIYNDQLRPADAIAEARTALRLMPNLKSLNQVASNQRGTANLGQAFAYFGMEEWARAYANDSYDPFWAGSHLFLADRYHGLFTKNSELFQGFLADPTAFGASNRNQTILQRPGNYFSASLRGTSAADTVHGTSPLVQVNGFANGTVPMAYFAEQERFKLRFPEGPSDITFSNLALGMSPRYDLGAFLFVNRNSDHATLQGDMSGAAVDLDDRLATTNLDLGFHFKRSPTSQIWFKAASFDSTDDIGGSLNAIPTTSGVTVRQPEFLLRHSFAAGDGHEITWGIEHATRGTSSQFYSETTPGFVVWQDYVYREETLDVYVADRWKVGPRLLVEAELAYQRQRRHADYLTTPIQAGVPFPSLAISDSESLDAKKVTPRLGVAYRFRDDALVRVAYQRWLRPAQFASLGPVATAGIPLDDRMVQRGGEMTRLRGQLEWELSAKSFVSGFVGTEKVEHHPFMLSPFAVNDLETLDRLTSRDLGALARDDLLEFALTPDYEAGRIRRAGAAFNRLLGREWGLFGRVLRTTSENTGPTYPGNRLPYLPQQAVAAGASWVNPAGWYFIGRAVHRSGRYRDAANTQALEAGWSGAFDLYWQSHDKRALLRFSVDDAWDKNTHPQYTAEATLRF